MGIKGMSRHRLAAGIAIAALGLAPAHAQEKPLSPITAPSGRGAGPFLGPWLEDHFQRMIMSCSPSGSRLQLTKVKKDSPFDVSAVPKDLRVALGLTDASRVGSAVAVRDGKSVIYLFANVYTKAEAATLTISSGANYLDTIRDDAPDFTTMPRVASAFLLQTCATTMSAALDANAGYTIPVISLKGGFEADYKAGSTFALSLTRTIFKSPILEAYNGNDTPDQSPFNAAMTMVGWHMRHPTRPDGNVLLDSFEGVALYEQSGLKRNTNISASASARGGIPLVVQAGTDTAASANWFTDFRANNYSVAIFQSDAGALTATTVPMPTLAEAVARAAATGRVTLDRQKTGDDLTLYNRAPRTLHYIVERLPAPLCLSDWRLRGGSQQDATLALAPPVAGQGADGWPVCRFAVTFQPSAAMPLGQERPIQVTLELPTGASAGAPAVALKAEDVVLKPLKYPHLARTGSDLRPVVVGTERNGSNVRTALEWKSQYQLTDNNTLAENVLVDLTDLTTHCTPSPDAASWVEPTRTLAIRQLGSAKVAELSLEMSWNGDFSTVGPEVTFAQCTISGPIIYTLKGGQTVTKDFPDLRFDYPVIRHTR